MHNRVCLTPLLDSLESHSWMLEEGRGVDIVYLDYQRTFVTVPNKRLLEKLRWYWIKHTLPQWIKDSLTDRTMRLFVNSRCSDWKAVLSGLPQGCLYYMWIIYQLGWKVKLRCLQMIPRSGKISHTEGALTIQKDLECLDEWLWKWLLKFNCWAWN